MNTKTTAEKIDELEGQLQCLSNDVLVAVHKGELDITKFLKSAMASRGLDNDGKWIGFAAAKKLHS